MFVFLDKIREQLRFKSKIVLISCVDVIIPLFTNNNVIPDMIIRIGIWKTNSYDSVKGDSDNRLNPNPEVERINE